MPQDGSRKAVNFDLISSELENVFGVNGRTKGYGIIRNFLESNGFEHRQGSGYHSLKPITNLDVLDLLAKFSEQEPWFLSCLNKIDVTNIGAIYDLAALLKQDTAGNEFDVTL